MSLGKVLVFTQAYNAEKTIARAMNSILNQTYQDWAYFVIDNASTDDTGLIIKDYAMRDDRIVYLSIENNQRSILGQFLRAVFKTTGADWHCQLDADDEYDVTFLEKMAAFASGNGLDIAMCGHDKVDGSTGEILIRKSMDRNLVIEGNGFLENFIEYRGFTAFRWAKLISVRLHSSIVTPQSANWDITFDTTNWDIALDSTTVLTLLKYAERAGVLGESLHKYYYYPNSLINTFTEDSFKRYEGLYFATRRYLEYYGAISKDHEDFLQAIFLSLFDEWYQILKKANIGLGMKLKYLLKMLGAANTQWMFRYEADPKFRNLAAREDYKQGIRDWVYAQAGIEQYRVTVGQIMNCLDVYPEQKIT
ncbi:hypothetical protein FACS1894216_11380 [Synergistales bacterium]|nr:hypothetical protein FACS1894216_11380 [Synergistales bacterium]